jgi:hypothetical protein
VRPYRQLGTSSARTAASLMSIVDPLFAVSRGLARPKANLGASTDTHDRVPADRVDQAGLRGCA